MSVRFATHRSALASLHDHTPVTCCHHIEESIPVKVTDGHPRESVPDGPWLAGRSWGYPESRCGRWRARWGGGTGSSTSSVWGSRKRLATIQRPWEEFARAAQHESDPTPPAQRPLYPPDTLRLKSDAASSPGAPRLNSEISKPLNASQAESWGAKRPHSGPKEISPPVGP